MWWDVWRVRYATYETVALEGDIKPVCVAVGLSFAEAQAMVERLGFGYCIKPSKTF